MKPVKKIKIINLDGSYYYTDPIPAEKVPDLIRTYFAECRSGHFACLNPHWWIFLDKDHLAYQYADDLDVEDEYFNYLTYPTPDELIKNEPYTFDGDDWVWVEDKEAGE